MKKILFLFFYLFIQTNSLPNNCQKLWVNYNDNQEVTLYMCKENITATTTSEPTTTTLQPTTTTTDSNIPSWFYEYLASQGWSPPTDNVETLQPTTTTEIPTTTEKPTTTTQIPTTEKPTTTTQIPTTEKPTTTQIPTENPTTTKKPTTTPIYSTTKKPVTKQPTNSKQNSSIINIPKSESEQLKSENEKQDIVIKEDQLIIIILGISCGVLLMVIALILIIQKCKCQCCEKKQPISPGNVKLKINEKNNDIETGLHKEKIKTLEPFKGKDFDILRKQSMDRKNTKNKGNINQEAKDILKPKLPVPPNAPPPNIQDAKQNFKKISKRLSRKNRNSWSLPNAKSIHQKRIQQKPIQQKPIHQTHVPHLPPIAQKLSDKTIHIKEITEVKNEPKIANVKQSNIPTLHADVTLDPEDKHMEFLLKQ